MTDLFSRRSKLSAAKRSLLEERLRGAIKAPSDQDAIPRRAKRDSAPLSFAQQRLWFIDQLVPNNPSYNIRGKVRWSGRLDLAVLERVINEIVRRHEVLRTRFEVVEGQPLQVIDDYEPRRLIVEDLTYLTSEEREEEARRIARNDAEAGFDLSRGPLLRVKALKVAEDEHVVFYTMHHIVSDGWSKGILVKEVEALYQAYSAGEESPLEELPIQYADFAAWQREWLSGKVLEGQVEYWRGRLKGAAVMELPTDYARPAAPSYRGGREGICIGNELSESLRRLGQRKGGTMFMVLMAAFKVLLMRYSGEEDLSVGTPVANRTRREVEGLIGFFVNTLVMRTDLSGNPSFRELVKREIEVALGAYAHQEAPFEKLVETINPERDMTRSPLFQALMTLDNMGQEELDLGPPNVNGAGGETWPIKFDLTLSLAEGEEGILGFLEYSCDLYEGETIRRMARHYERIVTEVATHADRRIRGIDLMSESEREQILVKWNKTEVEYPRDRLIQELFEEQVRLRPDRVAVVFEDQELSYRELNRRANQLALHLRRLGVGPEALVGIHVDSSLEMIVGALGILKAGGAYLPLDPTYPAERLRFMLEDGAPLAVLTEERLLGELPAFAGRIVCLDRDWSLMASHSEENLARQAAGENLAYIIYTSGSTGRPKGVMVEHANLVRLFDATAGWLHFDQNDVWTLFHSLAFDFSAWEIWGALVHGARLVVVSRPTTRTPSEFYQLLDDEQVTILNQTPSAFRQLMAAQGVSRRGHQLRRVIFGGEALEVATLKPWYRDRRNERAVLINMYGITETTVHVSYRPLEPSDGERFGGSPIGRRIPDLRVYLLDGDGQPVPVGVTAEIYIGGAGVARGYLNRPELTAERFVADPYTNEAGARMYKSGDLGRHLASGELEFIGRNDFQVKIRGYRIELGEIEAKLVEHAGVGEAVVIAQEEGGGARRLVAYYTEAGVSEGEARIRAEELREHLSAALPEYMAPAAYVKLEAMPLTPNGKLDRKALPQPGAAAYAAREYEAPVGETETALAEIWAEALKVERVGRHDNFFQLGGHSLMVVNLIEHMRQQGFYTDVRTFYVAPTLAALASAVTGVSDIVQVPSAKIPDLGKKMRI